MHLKSIAFLLVLLFLTSSCATVGYESTLMKWSKGQNIYSFNTFSAKIIWKSTYLAPEYRSIARMKIDEWKKIGPGNWSTYPNYLMDTEEGVFVIALYLPRGYPQLTVGSDNFWEFTLDLPGGVSYKPSSIESLNLTERESRLFPYINKWSSVYLVKFPVATLERPFSLALRSAGVTSFLDWKEGKVLSFENGKEEKW